jgi:hypothetical protein
MLLKRALSHRIGRATNSAEESGLYRFGSRVIG